GRPDAETPVQPNRDCDLGRTVEPHLDSALIEAGDSLKALLCRVGRGVWVIGAVSKRTRRFIEAVARRVIGRRSFAKTILTKQRRLHSQKVVQELPFNL